MTDETTDVVQPEGGQGDGGTSDAPYAEYLNRIPEEARGPAEEAFKAWDANYTRHQQEASEYRKSWEPYEQLGVNQYSPDQLSYLMQLGQALENPQVMQEWWNQYAEQNGLTPQQAAEQQQEFEQNGWEDPSQQLLKQELEQRLGPIQQRLDTFAQQMEQQEFAAREQEALHFIEGQLHELEEKHPKEFDRNLVEAFVGQYVDSDPQNAVPRAFEDLRKFRASIEKQALGAKVNTPPGAESGGVPDVNPEEIKDLKRAGEIARERIRQAREA